MARRGAPCGRWLPRETTSRRIRSAGRAHGPRRCRWRRTGGCRRAPAARARTSRRRSRRPTSTSASAGRQRSGRRSWRIVCSRGRCPTRSSRRPRLGRETAATTCRPRPTILPVCFAARVRPETPRRRAGRRRSSGVPWIRILPFSSALRIASGVNCRSAATPGALAGCGPSAVPWHDAQLTRNASAPSCAIVLSAGHSGGAAADTEQHRQRETTNDRVSHQYARPARLRNPSQPRRSPKVTSQKKAVQFLCVLGRSLWFSLNDHSKLTHRGHRE